MNIRFDGRNIIRLFVIGVFAASIPAFADNGPELPSGVTPKPLVYGKKTMVVTNNKYASEAAQQMLEKGGTAVDAAIAAGFVLGLTEPQSSGIGGGGYALTYNKATKKTLSYDGREVAPASATQSLFLDSTGKPLDFNKAMLTIQSVGVPSEVALFMAMHKREGKLTWTTLLQPAIQLATQGFPLSPRLHHLLTADEALLRNSRSIKQVYFSGEHIKPVGSIVTNPDYARTLRIIAQNPNDFYKGEFAKEIIAFINNAAKKKLMKQSDFEQYQVVISNAVCSWYRDQYHVCTVSPSSAGGVTVQMLMGIYANNFKGTDYQDSMWWFHFLEASKLAFADRDEYLADPAFVKVPVAGLLSPAYLLKRSRLVDKFALETPVSPGIPLGSDMKYAGDRSPKARGTTSLAIVDKDGNAVSMTLTIEHQFGSHYFMKGFFLNNELTDFSFTFKDANGRPVANRVEPRKRPRSSIASAMVFDKHDELHAVSGAPGGSDIICYVAKNLILMLDMHLMPNQASATTNLCSANKDPVIEQTDYEVKGLGLLSAMGERVVRAPMVSGVTNILRNPISGWYGAADPRREGVALGS